MLLAPAAGVARAQLSQGPRAPSLSLVRVGGSSQLRALSGDSERDPSLEMHLRCKAAVAVLCNHCNGCRGRQQQLFISSFAPQVHFETRRGRQQQNRGTCSLLQGQATAEQRHLFSAAEAGNRRTEATVLCYRGRRQPQNRGNCSLLQRRAAAGHSVHMTVDSQARALAAAWPGARY